MRMITVLLLFFFDPFSFVYAAESGTPPPPRVSEAAAESALENSDEGFVADGVTIVKGKDTTVEEYRRGGHLYMIKVIPTGGPAYYLMDTDGDGFLETTRNDLIPNLLIPNWVLFSW